jgi:autotransporter-associated beta strand protein
MNAKRIFLTLATFVAGQFGLASGDTFHWTPTAGGTHSWNSAANWTPNAAFPDAADAVANVTTDIAGDQTINLNERITLGTLNIGDPNSTNAFTIAGNGGSLIFNIYTGEITVSSTSKGDIIAANISGAPLITQNSPNPFVISGVISGYSLAKRGPGTLVLTAVNNHTNTTVSEGTLKLGSGATLGNGYLDVRNGAVADLNGNNVSVSGLDDGLDYGGIVTNNSDTSDSTLTVELVFGTGVQNQFDGTLIDGPSRKLSLVVNRATQGLQGTNPFSGTATLNQGSLYGIGFDGATPVGTGSVILNGGRLHLVSDGGGHAAMTGVTEPGSTVSYSGGALIEVFVGIFSEAITYTLGNESAAAGSVLNRAEPQSTLSILAGNGIASLAGIAKLKVNRGVPMINGIVAPCIVGQDGGSNGTYFGDFLRYDSANGFMVANYTGGNINAATNTTVFEANTLTVNVLTADRNVYALKNQNQEIILGGHTLTIGNGSGQAGLITNGDSVPQGIFGGTLAFGAAEAVIYTASIAVQPNIIDSTITGSGGLTVFGQWVLELRQSSSYTGTTRVTDGILQVANATGSATGNGPVIVGNTKSSVGSVLSGNGHISGPVTVKSGGRVFPGDWAFLTPALLSIGSFMLEDGADFLVYVGNTGSYSQLNVTGEVVLAGDLSVGFNNDNPQRSFIILNDGTDPVTGTFKGLPHGGTYSSISAGSFWISYRGDSATNSLAGGNDVALQRINSLDTDGDVMPDDYETIHGFNPNDPADGSLDADGDGASNANEYRAGTNPNDRLDFLHVTEIAKDGSNVDISFTTVAGRSYELHSTSDLAAGSWETLISDIYSFGGIVTVTDPNATSQPRRFYRAAVLPEP